MRPASPRMNIRVFSVFLIVGLLMLAIASAFVLGIGAARLRDSYGANLTQVADHTVAAVDVSVFRRIIDASMFARVPDVRKEADAGSQRPFDAKAAQETDLLWQRAPGLPLAVKDLFGTQASQFLAEVSRDNPVYRELFVTDRFGRIVAASGKTSNYLQAGENWWREAFADGVHGKLTVSDVRWDESSKVYALEIAVPVPDQSGAALSGVLKVLADINEIGAVVGGVRMGSTGGASLLREDGTFVFSREQLDPKARFFATDLLSERLDAVRQGKAPPTLNFRAKADDGTMRLVGVALSQLKASYPSLVWVVAVSQDEDELFAPVRAQWTSLIIVLALTALAVVLFALWFTMRLASPPPDSELHLVEHAKKAVTDEGEA